MVSTDDGFLIKDEKGRWFFTRGIHASELLDDVVSTQKGRYYASWCIQEVRSLNKLQRQALYEAIEEAEDLEDQRK